MRRAVASDIDAAAAVLADAFADYPWTRWTIDGERHEMRIERLQRLCMERLVLPFGEVWLACDDERVFSVSMWMLPGEDVPPSAFAAISAEQAELEGSRHAASITAEAVVAPLRPTVPHYYLGAVGTRRDAQGRGYATAVLTPVLDRASREGQPTFLETSAATNVSLYTRLGFAVVGETDVPDGGPHVWAMLRAVR